uniref:Transposon Ty3-I Gag-Pol polyprotein n=1 Tax=Cajanus cajan TaxID=3821 RepID=A0A151RXR7_CAJCA|nr:hypothetical protein KK1_031025 [Cajanus cajan]
MARGNKVEQNPNLCGTSLEHEDNLSLEMQRLMDQENRIIQPYQEEIEKINLGEEADKREISISTKIKKEVRDRLINLMKEYVDIFAWSYHDMSGLDREIVKQKLPIKDRIPTLKSAMDKHQRRIKRAFDKKVQPRPFEEGDLVLKKLLPAQKDKIGKWTPNYEGPYVVKRAFSRGALILTNMDES